MTDDAEMRAAFALTDEGLMAFLYGLVDTLLMGDTLKPADRDTPADQKIKTLGRGYRDAALKMLDRLSGLDEIHAAIMAGEPMWASQNALSHALGGAMGHGIDVANYAAPRYTPATDEVDEELVEQIAEVLRANPALSEKLAELYPDDDTDQEEQP